MEFGQARFQGERKVSLSTDPRDAKWRNLSLTNAISKGEDNSIPVISYREAKQVAPECPMPVVEPHLALTAPLSCNRQDNL
jgi:hypothetical protein